ncbi:MAG TPA: hypothetical protein VF945_08420 [Polyangia bacterium]
MATRARLAALLVLAACSLAACGGPGHVQYDNDRCLIDGQPASIGEVETRQAAVAARIQSRQPWFAVVTIIIVLVAGASNAEKAMVLLRARKHEGENRPLSARIRDALDRHRQSPLRFGAIVGSTLGLLLVAAGLYVYLDVDKRASERALGMLQFCHLALRTTEEQGVLAEQRKNLTAIQSTAGDIRALVDKLPPEEKEKAREIVAQLNSALEKQGKIVGDYLSRSDEQQKALVQHNAFVEKGLSSLSTDVGALKSLPATLKDIGDGVKKLDGKVAAEDGSVKALSDKLADLDDKLQKLLARPACEPPKPQKAAPTVVAIKPPADLGVAKP